MSFESSSLQFIVCILLTVTSSAYDDVQPLDVVNCTAQQPTGTDECDVVANECPANSHCILQNVTAVNSNGNVSECVCNYGFKPRGHICEKICPDISRCRNRRDDRECACIRGYNWNPYTNECREYRSTVYYHTLIKSRMIGEDYYRTLRPVKNYGDITYMTVAMSFKQILDINEREQYLHTNAWFTITWIDELVQWNPDEYGGIESIFVDPRTMWRPDVVLFNSVDETRTATEMFTDNQIQVFYFGLVKWVSPTLIKTACKLNIAYYPFDVQVCNVHLGMWASNKSEVYIRNVSQCYDIDSYVENHEWELRSIRCSNNPKTTHETGSSMMYQVVMQRRSMFYLFHFVFPSIVLVVLGNFVFFLPSESSERALLAMTVYLSMIVYMEVILKSRPRSSEDLSTLDTFFGAVLFLFMVLTAEAVIVLNIHTRGRQGREPPIWLQKLFLLKMSQFTDMRSSAPYMLAGTTNSATLLRSRSICLSNQFINIARARRFTASSAASTMQEQMIPILLKIHQLAVRLRTWNQQEAKTGHHHLNISDTQWRMIAIIVDRICFFIFAVLTIVLMVTLFMYQIPGLTPAAQYDLIAQRKRTHTLEAVM